MNKLEPQDCIDKYSNIASCPIRNVVSRFSGKWSMLILCVLSENENIRFGELLNAIPDISPKVLASVLKGLESDGLVRRMMYAEMPPRTEYSLTDLGLSVMPHLNGLIGWALENYSAFEGK